MTKRTPGRAIRSKGTRSTLAGLWGEVLAQEALAAQGWTVSSEESGGYRKAADFWAQYGESGKWLVGQVKATAKPSGSISWGKPGAEGVKPLLIKAARWDAHAIFVLLHLEPSDAYLTNSRIIVTRPSVLNITGVTAEEWGVAVDRSRALYASQPYVRGNLKGQLKPERGRLHPCRVQDFPPLDELLRKLNLEVGDAG